MARLSRLSRSVEGRAALITGAASGMGRATAHLFADEGALVAVTDLGVDRVQAVVDEISEAGGSAHGWVLDVADATQIARVVDEVAGHFGRLDIVVNNAGISLFGPVDTPDYEDNWLRSLDVLLTSHVRMVRAALPYLRRSDAARIINIASTEALGATRFGSTYTAAKTGVTGLTRSLAVELGREGNITVNCICPGAVRTGMTAEIPEEAKQEFARRRVPLARYAEPEEIAQMTLNLALPASSYVNGAVIPVDAGLTIKNA
jgi:3-oxoacyl-[acyl-carrier protein] reductase